MSLETLLHYADEHSPVLSVAQSTRSRAEAARVAATVLPSANPSLSVAIGPRLGTAGTGVDVEAGVWQQLQVAGERGLRKQAAVRLRDLTDEGPSLADGGYRGSLHNPWGRYWYVNVSRSF